MNGLTMDVRWETRLCEVGNKTGYFHCWENYSTPLEANPLTGGSPAGTFSKIFGIVEFSDGVERVDPIDIHFCDEQNAMLRTFDERKEQNDKAHPRGTDRYGAGD